MNGRFRHDPPLCVPLDVPDLELARRLLDSLEGTVPVFKVGLELFCAEGPAAAALVVDRGAALFLDLKINDIPRTAAGAVRAAGRLGASYVTLHGSGGRAMIAAARSAAPEGLGLLVVSVLTSLDGPALAETGVARSVPEQVEAMAQIASEEGAHGLVLSPAEVAAVRAAHPDLFLVTPGVRPAGSDVGDQRRTDSPAAAIAAGADLLVVGRPIITPNDPARAAAEIVDEIRATAYPAAERSGAP